jgi:hypothetical protein
MSVAAARTQPMPSLDEAFVVAAEIVAGHDGAAELMVRLRHGNGALSSVTLDPGTGFDLLRVAGAASLDGLIGRSWRDITRGLWEL